MNDTPDPRPVGETLSETVLWTVRRREELEEAVLEYGSVCCTRASTGHDTTIAMREIMTALDAYRDAVAAEARAALLAGAPVVYVATDRGADISQLSPGRWEMHDGVAFANEDSEAMTMWGHPPLTPPGTVRRYALVPLPEEETP